MLLKLPTRFPGTKGQGAMPSENKRPVHHRTARLLFALSLLASATVIAAVPAKAQSGPDAARVLTLAGRVSLERDGELWVLAEGQAVRSGQVLTTGPDGYAQLQLSDQSVIEVFPNSRVVLQANPFNWHELLDLYLGKIRLRIQKLTNGDPPYRVTTPTAVISVRGTVFDVDVNAGQETLVQVENGSVSVRHRLMPGKEITVEAGQSLRVTPNVPLAAAKAASTLLVVGRVARAIGETVAQTRVGKSGGSSGGSAPSSGGGTPGAGTAAETSGSNTGSNEPAPPPGQDGRSAPPGDVTPP